MSQYDFGTIDATKTGIDLANDLNLARTAWNTGHKGNTAPSYKIVGTRWVDDSGANPRIMVWDGTSWLEEVEFDTTTNQAIYNSQRFVIPSYVSPTSLLTGDIMIDSTDGYLALGHPTNIRSGGPNEWETISHNVQTSIASLTFTGMNYRKIRIRLLASPATDNVDLWFRTSSNNGVSYDNGASDYLDLCKTQQGATVISTQSGAAAQLPVWRGTNQGNLTNETLDAQIEIHDFNQASYTTFNIIAGCTTLTPDYRVSRSVGHRTQATACNAFQILYSTGNIAHIWYLVEAIF